MKKNNVVAVLLAIAALVAGAWALGLFKTSGRYDNAMKWHPSYRHTDDLPFGMELFDSVMSNSLPKGYRFQRMTIAEAAKADSAQHLTLMYVEDVMILDTEETQQLLDFVARGNNLLLVTDEIRAPYIFNEEDEPLGASNTMARQLDLSVFGFQDFNFSEFKDSLLAAAKDSVRWSADGHLFHMPPQMITAALNTDSRANRVRATTKVVWLEDDGGGTVSEDMAVLIERSYGKGKVVVGTNVLMFTNYGVLHPEISAYLGRVMHLVDNFPVVRFMPGNNYSVRDDDSQEASPLSFLLKNKPTRWALFVALAAIALFFVFRARRRQRVIPVMPQPENKSVELAQVMGTIYYRRGDHRDLLNKKFRYFAYEVRQRLFVDITDPEKDRHSVAALASVTGMAASELQQQLNVIRSALEPDDRQLDGDQLRHYIAFLNKVLMKLRS